jgi:hypothetical protein
MLMFQSELEMLVSWTGNTSKYIISNNKPCGQTGPASIRERRTLGENIWTIYSRHKTHSNSKQELGL